MPLSCARVRAGGRKVGRSSRTHSARHRSVACAPKSRRAAGRKSYRCFTRCRALGLTARSNRADLQFAAPGRPGQIYNARPTAVCRGVQKRNFWSVFGFKLAPPVRSKKCLSSFMGILKCREAILIKTCNGYVYTTRRRLRGDWTSACCKR